MKLEVANICIQVAINPPSHFFYAINIFFFKPMGVFSV